jgi:hypothetical protein
MICQPSYTGTALPLATTTVTLFSTVTAFQAKRGAAMYNCERFSIDLLCDHDGTLKAYKSTDRGVNWSIVGSVAVTGSTTVSTIKDYLIGMYEDWKLDFLVGASDETVFKPSMALTSDRAQG